MRLTGHLLRVMVMLAAIGCWAQSKTAPTSPPAETTRKSAERGGHGDRHHGEDRHHRGVAHPPKALVQDPEPAPAPPPPPPTLAQQPPNAPQINYRNGLLTVAANNSTMGDILNLVQRKTGADIDYPPSLSQERVAAVVGPAPAPQVLATLLNGTRFDYILVGMNGRPDLLQRAIITASASGGASQSAGGASPQPSNVASTPAQQDEEAPEETTEQPEEAPPPPPQPVQPNPNQYPQQRYPQPYGQQPAQGEQPQQQQPKTPEQLLQELQRMQQQQQQNQQQQQQEQ